ncbi:MAG TPA: protease, partial [Thermoanaerobaculia bacterium]|nr:protease [Thermoanaerobaculia bacterium]
MLLTGLLVAAMFTLAPVPGRAASNLLPRFPTLHGNDIVFEAAGNLWWVARQGGDAVRLTSDRGYDMMPRFSPDGKWIAFTGQYDNSTDVFVIPAAGGVAKRLTYHSDVVDHAQMRWGPDNMVVTWTPDSKKIVFLSRRTTFNDWFGQLFEVPVTGGLPRQLPVPKGGVTSFNADGSKIAYNRIFRNFRTWKRYTGGLAQDVWLYDFNSHETTRVTDWKGTDTYPMWDGNTLYFASDRGSAHRMNIWAYDLGTHQFRQVTHFTNYDIDWPSLGNDGIVFQQGGSLYVLDLPAEKLHELNINIPADGVRTRVRWADASKQIRDFDLAPNGKRALFAARGDIFTVPAQHGNTRDLTQTSNADERYPSWSPDGRWIAYATDSSGEEELAIRPADGSGKEELVTSRKEGYFYTPVWSPDGKKLAVSDNEHRLMFVDIASKRLTEVAHDPEREIHDYAWSPDSRWIAYSLTTANRLRSVYLYSLETGKSTQVTSNLNADGSPTFSQDGKYLFFVSGRHENATFSESEFNIATLDMDGIYVLTLQAGEKSPFAPRSDEGVVEKKGENGMKNGEKAEKKGAKHENGEGAAAAEIKPIKIDLAGIEKRIDRVPIPSANIGGLFALKGKLLYSTRPNQTISGPLSGESSALHVYD